VVVMVVMMMVAITEKGSWHDAEVTVMVVVVVMMMVELRHLHRPCAGGESGVIGLQRV
jgi:hypothetical protein